MTKPTASNLRRKSILCFAFSVMFALSAHALDLHVGPDGNGVVQPEAIAILLETGKLLEANPIKKSNPTITAVPRLKQDKPAPAKEQANPAASAGLL